MAEAMPVRSPKQSARAAATLYSPPETCTSNVRALRKGATPGSKRCTRAPRARKSRAQASVRIGKSFIVRFPIISGKFPVLYSMNDRLQGGRDGRQRHLLRLLEKRRRENNCERHPG